MDHARRARQLDDWRRDLPVSQYARIETGPRHRTTDMCNRLLVAFDPSDGNTIVAGGADSGVFLSNDAGNIWTTLTDNSGASNPHLPRPRYAYFDREGGLVNIYVGTVRVAAFGASASQAATPTLRSLRRLRRIRWSLVRISLTQSTSRTTA